LNAIEIMDKACKFQGKINDQPVYFLVDTGSQLNAVRRSFVESLIPTPELISNVTKITTAEGNTSYSYHKCNLEVSLGGLTCTETFQVMDKCNQTAVLGTPFMSNNNITLMATTTGFTLRST